MGDPRRIVSPELKARVMDARLKIGHTLSSSGAGLGLRMPVGRTTRARPLCERNRGAHMEMKGNDMKKALTYLVAAVTVATAAPAFAEGDVAEGEKVFKKCKACHAVGEDAKNKVGPMLNGIVGAPAGKVEGFKYSANLLELAEGGLTWDDATLAAYLTKPKDVIPKGKMSFAGLKKEEDIANVVAYLATFE